MSWDFSELDAFSRDLLGMANDLDKGKHTKKFLRKQGNELKKRTVKAAKLNVNMRTGNLFKGIKRGRVYKYGPTGAWSIRVYAGKPAGHAHLVDRGHRLVKNGKEIGYVPGKNFFAKSKKEFKDEFYKNTDKFLDELLDKHGLGG